MSLELEERYSRQILFRGWARRTTTAGEARVAMVGCGATGRRWLPCWRAPGRHHPDHRRDYVEPSNLQRQTLFDESDGESHCQGSRGSAKNCAFNSQIVVEPRWPTLRQTMLKDCLKVWR